jgi:serine/threonine-protein kinase RsbW
MFASVQAPAPELRIQAGAEWVRDASLWLARSGAEFGIPDDQLNRLDLCLNEALANIISHGCPAALTELIHLRMDMSRNEETQEQEATVTVSDAGSAFDTTTASTKPRPQTLDEAEPGGLGLLMIRSFSDKLSYSYSDGRNHLSFGVRWLAPVKA